LIYNGEPASPMTRFPQEIVVVPVNRCIRVMKKLTSFKNRVKTTCVARPWKTVMQDLPAAGTGPGNPVSAAPLPDMAGLFRIVTPQIPEDLFKPG